MNHSWQPVRVVALDLDGTLIDSAPDLAAAVNRMLAARGMTVLSTPQITAMIGDGIHTLVERALTASMGEAPSATLFEAAADQALGYYRSALFEHSRIYTGVRETIAALRERGMTICCVTNKVSSLSLPLLAASGLLELLDHVVCADTPAERKPAPKLLQRACVLADSTPAALVMVGDAPVDIAAAHAAGARAVAVTYGYTPVERLAAAAPDALIDSLAALLESPVMHGRSPT